MPGNIYEPSAEGIAALQEIATSLTSIKQEILDSSENIQSLVEGLECLGPHAESLITAINNIENSVSEVSSPVETIAKRMNEVADGYQEIINDDPFADMDSSFGTSFGSSEVGSGSNTNNEPYRATPTNQILNGSGLSGYQDSTTLQTMESELQKDGVDYKEPAYIGTSNFNTDQYVIIKRIGGWDCTEGSCSSQAFTYIANKAGYDVKDFRGGKSREYFADSDNIDKICKLPGVISQKVMGLYDIDSVKQLISDIPIGKEYYLACGGHAAIIRRYQDGSEEGYEYLELQRPDLWNDWYPLDEESLRERFGCNRFLPRMRPAYLIDAESLMKSKDFIKLVGYINTSEDIL